LAASYVAGIVGRPATKLLLGAADTRSVRRRGLTMPSPLPCAVALAALIAIAPVTRPPPPPGAVADDRVDDRVIGTVHGPVVTTPRGFGARLDTASSTVWVWSDRVVAPGQRLAVTGRLSTPRRMLDPGGVHAGTGGDWELVASQVELLDDDPSAVDRAWRWAAATRASWVQTIDASGGADADAAGRAALDGIVTGARGAVPAALDARWRAVGIYHVLSVSGLHLAVVAGLAFSLLRRLVAASPLGGRVRPARWAAPPALAIAIAYTLVTGGQLATIRALIVIAIVLAGHMLDRPIRLVDALGVAAIALLLWRPADLADPSFQLSFVAASTLALRPRADVAGGPVWRWVVRGMTTSAWVAITTAPITAYHFHQVAAGGVVGNLVLTPIVELVALPLGLVGIALDAVVPGAGAMVLRVAAWLVARVDDLAGLLAHATPVGTIAIGSPIVATALVALAIWLAMRPRRTRLDAGLWLVTCLMWAIARTPPPPGALRVTFLDVGQGDAALVELPDGATWLIDAGGLASARSLDAAAAPGRAIARTLEVYGHSAIDLAIISHPHPDHYLGLAALGATTPIAELWSVDERALPGSPPPARVALPGFGELATALAARGTRLGHPSLGIARREAGVELVVWAPRYTSAADAPAIEAADPVRSVNDNSLVVAIRFAGRTLLFAGDVEAEGEDALVAAGVGHVDVVKVPHHGSPTSSSAAFVAATSPRVAVISCGVANSFGFPSPAVIARWRSAGAAVERTDVAGAITITVDADGALAIDRFAAASP
jgi:competence protein ComEC